MRKYSIIYCVSKKETLSAIKIYQGKLGKNLIILCPTIEGQLLLKKHNIHNSLYEVESCDLNTSKNSCYKNSLYTFDLLRLSLPNLTEQFTKSNILDICMDYLLVMYQDIFHSYDTYRSILKKWDPQTFYMPKAILNYREKRININFYSLPYFIFHYFTSDSSTLTLYGDNSSTNHFLPNHIFYFIRKKLALLKLLVIRAYYQSHKLKESNLLPADIIMQTGGLITFYYTRFYQLISRHSKFKLITYKLHLAQEVQLFNLHIPFIKLDSFSHLADKEKVQTETARLMTKLSMINKVRLPNIPVSLGLAITHETISYIKQNLKNILRKISINNKIIQNTKPKLVINSHDPSITGTSFVLPAKSLGIPSVLLLHGIPIGFSHPKHFSDEIILWGRKSGNYLNKADVKKSYAGFPAVDKYYHLLQNLHTTERLPAHNHQKLTIGMFLTTYHPNDSYQARFFGELLGELRSIKDKVQLSLRFHEGYNIEGTKNLASYFGINLSDKSHIPLEQFVEKSDVILSWDTTALIWAMLFKKPIFHTTPIWSAPLINTKEYNAAWIPENAKDFAAHLKKYMKDNSIIHELLKGQKKFLEDYAGSLYAHSSERLQNHILSRYKL